MKVVDMHCDTISEIYERRKKGENLDLRKNGLHLDLEKMKKGDYFYRILPCLRLLRTLNVLLNTPVVWQRPSMKKWRPTKT